MASYLYVWNPAKWDWMDLEDGIYHVINGEPYERYWSCGNTKHIEVGDTFFLLRVGVEPKGVIGCGYITSTPYLLPHWDEEKKKQGKTALRTDLLFKALSREPIFPLPFLNDQYPSVDWTPQGGGVSIPASVADDLFMLIQQNPSIAFEKKSKDDVIKYSEGKARELTLKSYDRNPFARQACIEHYGYGCSVCGFNFEKVYGTFGGKYIEVHHLHQVADFDEEHFIDPIQDLRPVCANCHRMLHKRRPPLSIEELKSLLLS